MKTLVRILRLVLVNKYSYVIYPTLTATSLLFLFYCIYSSGCLKNATDTENTRSIRDVNKLSGTELSECYLFLLIISSPKAITQRKAIRDTWLKLKTSGHVNRKFFIGTKGLSQATQIELAKEQIEHSDLLFLNDFVDSYESLTEKLLRSIVWVSRYINAKFVMKLDDDSFVRLDTILSDLQLKQYLGRLYWGFFRGNSIVKRIGKWAENSWYLSDHYLPYALGGGYILSSELIEYVARNHDMLQFYKSEDVSLGVWLAPVKLNRIHDIRFDTEFKSRGCNNTDVVSHKQKPEDMYAKYDQLVHNNRLCKVEKETSFTFDYNWGVPPSQCCKRVKRSSL